MLFPTVEFAIFFLAVFLTSWAARPYPFLRKLILLGASYVFYAYWDWRFALLLFEVTLANFLFGLWMDGTQSERRRAVILTLTVAFNLTVLAYFKYWGFFLSSMNELLLALGFERDSKILEALLPVGVSFFTFQGISYVVDIYRRQLRATTAVVDFLLYPSFFPHLVAGPIVRAADLLPQLEKPADASAIRADRAFVLIAMGLFKKVVIAHYLAVELVNPVFEAPRDYGTVDLLAATYGYAVQIYCDFSAYSDIAIGIALLFGINFLPNFAQPYRATSLRDFWHRWHISLSTWLRDYLYIPLGGSKAGRFKTYRNLMLTMLLGGLWHGAAWNFVFWGFLHGGGLAVERFLDRRGVSLPLSRAGTALRIVLTFHFVCLAWIFFAADSFDVAIEFLGSFANTAEPVRVVSTFTVGLLAVGMIGQFLPADLVERVERLQARVPLYAQAAVMAAVVLTVSAFGPGALAPFIYFRF